MRSPLLTLLISSLLCTVTELFAQEGPRLSGVVVVKPVPGRTAKPGIGPQNVGADFRMNQDTGVRHQNETFIAINPLSRKNFIGTSNDYRAGPVHAGFYASLDGGKTFVSDGVFPFDRRYSNSGDPSCCFDGKGNGYICYLEFNRVPLSGALFVSSTSDGGKTWPKKNLAWLGSSRHLPDKPLLGVDPRTTGTFAGSLYITFTGFFVSPIGINLVYSRDQGKTWSRPVRVDRRSGGQGSVPRVGTNGEVYVAWQNRGRRAIVFQRSTDGGKTFLASEITLASIVSNPRTLPPTRFRVNSFPGMDVDHSSSRFRGRIYVIWSSRSGSSSEVFLVSSDNGGNTWTSPLRINDVTRGDQFFSWVSVDEHGTVFAAWYDRRLDPANVNYDIYASASYDGGKTWLKNWRISSKSSNPNIGFNGTFIGDYMGIAASHGLLMPSWCDTTRGNQDAFTAVSQSDLESSVTTISAVAGGTITMPLRAGPAHGNEVYVLVAGLSGTTPPLKLGGGVFLFLVPDALTTLSLAAANTPIFMRFIGSTDANGIANVAAPVFSVPPGLLSPVIGKTLSFAYLTIGASLFRYGSNPLGVKITR